MNLFLLPDMEQEEESFFTEIQVMIAEKDYRRKGLAEEACRKAIELSKEIFGSKSAYLRASILKENEASIKLFRDKLGFTFLKSVEAFQEEIYILK